MMVYDERGARDEVSCRVFEWVPVEYGRESCSYSTVALEGHATSVKRT